MSMEPFDWGVVVVGKWNTALFTPAGIAEFVFGKKDPQQLNVLIPLDGQSPYLVESPDAPLVVTADAGRLRILPKEMTSEVLAKAQVYGLEAIQRLPRTPLVAAGINVKFKFSELDDALIDALRSSIDGLLTDAGYVLTGWGVDRVIPFESGVLNLSIKGTDKSQEIGYNFHRASDNETDLIEWLKTPTERILKRVESIQQAIGLPLP